MSRKSYHHGNLKSALVDAVLSLISEKGPNGFSFAEAARRAGVSPAAPYRHFKDRDDLIVETARRGYELFAGRLEAAWDEGRPSALSAFERVGRAYLGFAKAEPAYFAAMFEAGVSPDHDSELRAAADRAFRALHRSCEALAAKIPAEKRPPVLMMSYHIWALSHGVTALFGRGDDARRATPISAEDLLEAGAGIYLRGLGFLPEED
ncbi:MAG: TetR/AcrR family transcriptional regulator [Pseudomonadota bacterium]